MSRILLSTIAILGFMASAPMAAASDWGCEVALCLASPQDPLQYSACVPPIKKLYRELAKGKGFPSCASAGGAGSIRSNYYRHLYGNIEVAGYERRGRRNVPVNSDGEELICYTRQRYCRIASEVRTGRGMAARGGTVSGIRGVR